MKKYYHIFIIFMFASVFFFSGYSGSPVSAKPKGVITAAANDFSLSGFDQTNKDLDIPNGRVLQ